MKWNNEMNECKWMQMNEYKWMNINEWMIQCALINGNQWKWNKN